MILQQDVNLSYRRVGPPWRRRWAIVLAGFDTREEAGSFAAAMFRAQGDVLSVKRLEEQDR